MFRALKNIVNGQKRFTMIKNLIDTLLKTLNLKITFRDRYVLLTRYSREYKRREDFFNHLNLDTVIDIGAHKGGFAEKVLSYGFSGEILSFEPVSTNFKLLIEKAKEYPSWKTYNLALGSESGHAEINISQNTHSSSMLPVLESHLEAASDAQYIGKESVEVSTLDAFFNELPMNEKRILLKIDTQGYERNVLQGGNDFLDKVLAVQLEVSLIPLYKDSWLLKDVISFFEGRGFYLASIENGFYNKKTGQLLQIDTIFIKNR